MNRIRFRYACGKELRYLSHLDLTRLFQRAMRRACLPLAYTLGYTPRPRLSLAAPLPVGVTASREYGEIYLAEPLSPDSFCRRLGEELPIGLTLTGAAGVEPDEPPLAALINAALYSAIWKGERSASAPAELQKSLDQLLARPEIMISRPGKVSEKAARDIRPFIYSVEIPPAGEEGLELRLLLQVGSKGGVSPFRVLEQLSLEGGFYAEEQRWALHRQGLYIFKEKLIDPFPEGGEKCTG